MYFAAHNENDPQIDAAITRYKNDIHVLHWREMLDGYIADGVAKSLLCVDDKYGHSTSLAGYIGAKMLFNCLFGEDPKPISPSLGIITQSYADSILNGHTPRPARLLEESSIKRFK